jgi:hypothetical protein
MFPSVFLIYNRSISDESWNAPIIGPPITTLEPSAKPPAASMHSFTSVPTGTRSISGSITAPETDKTRCVTGLPRHASK